MWFFFCFLNRLFFRFVIQFLNYFCWFNLWFLFFVFYGLIQWFFIRPLFRFLFLVFIDRFIRSSGFLNLIFSFNLILALSSSFYLILSFTFLDLSLLYRLRFWWFWIGLCRFCSWWLSYFRLIGIFRILG